MYEMYTSLGRLHHGKSFNGVSHMLVTIGKFRRYVNSETWFDNFSLASYHRGMAKRAGKGAQTHEFVPNRHIFLTSIVLMISIIALTLYDYSVGESIFDHNTKGGVLSAQVTPTVTPYITPTNTPR